MIETYDIQININISAESEKEAEQKIASIMQQEMTKPALERAVNAWDFLEYVFEDEEPDEAIGI